LAIAARIPLERQPFWERITGITAKPRYGSSAYRGRPDDEDYAKFCDFNADTADAVREMFTSPRDRVT